MESSPPSAPPPPPPSVALRPRRAPRWGLGDAVLAFVLAVVAGVIGSTVVAVATGYQVQPHVLTPVSLTIGAAVGQYGVWLLVIGLVSARKGVGTIAADFGLRIRLDDWYFVPVGIGFTIVAGTLLLPISHLIKGEKQGVVDDLHRARGLQHVAMILIALVAAPVVEELFFRGLLLRSLLRRTSAPVAVMIGAVVFGASHLLDGKLADVAIQPALIGLGALSGYLAVRTGNLSRSILLHAGFNFLGVLGVVALTIR